MAPTTPLGDYLASATIREVLDLIVAEFTSDPTSQACFDRRLVERAIALMQDGATCAWNEDADGVSKTACGSIFALDDNSRATENGLRFCHFCGKRIRLTSDTKGHVMNPATRRPDPLRVAQVTIDRAKRWPIGQAVTVTKDDGSRVDTTTRSAPWKLGPDDRGTWVILLDGISGGYALARVEPR